MVPVGDQGARARQGRVEPVDVRGVVDRPDPVPLVGAVDVLVVREAARACGRRARGPAAGPRWTSRMGAGFSSHVLIRSARSPTCSGWMPSCGMTARSPSEAARCAMSSAPTRPRTVRPRGGVLVHVDGRLGVPEQLSGLAPALQAARRRRGRVARTGEPWPGRRSGRASAASRGRAAASAAAPPRVGRPPGSSPSEHRRGSTSVADGRHAGGLRGAVGRRPTTSRCSISTGSSTSVARPFRAPPSTWPRPARAGSASRSSPTTPRGHPRRGRPPARPRRGRRRPTTWSRRPRRRRGCCATGSARAPPWPCSGGRGLDAALPGRGARARAGRATTRWRWCPGYGPDVLWRDVMRAAVLVRDGLPWVASNTDLTIPTTYGTAPGHGVLVGLLREFTGVRADGGRQARTAAAGRDHPPGGRERPLMVGDRLDTDIDGAINAGCDSLLVMTGVTELAELVAVPAGRRPTYVAPDLGGLLEAHASPTAATACAELGGWRARADGGRLTVDGRGVSRRLVAGGRGVGVGAARRRRRARGHGRTRAAGGLSQRVRRVGFRA